MKCSSCKHFKDQGCETPTDCAWRYECVKIGGVYEPVGEIVDAVENIRQVRKEAAQNVSMGISETDRDRSL